MTTTSAEPFVLAPLAPAAPAPVASDGGAGLGARISNDWSDVRIDTALKNREGLRSNVARARERVEAGERGERGRPVSSRQERSGVHSSLAAARAKVEARAAGERIRPAPTMTKAERLAREVGSESERRDTRSSVAKAIAKVGNVLDRDESNAGRATMRDAVETLQRRYPGKSAADFVRIAKTWEADFRRDPIAAREKLLATYSTVSPDNHRFRDAAEGDAAQKGHHGVRAAIRRAQQDQTNSEGLAEFEKEFGHNLPAVLAELVRHDAAMVKDPVNASARMATNYGAPAVESQVPAYEARMQAQRQAEAKQRQFDSIQTGLQKAVEHKILPPDDASHHEIAAVLENPAFKRTASAFNDLQRAVKIVAHPDHVWKTGKKAAQVAKKRDAGSLSISGGPSTAGESGRSRDGRFSRTDVGAAVDRAIARG